MTRKHVTFLLGSATLGVLVLAVAACVRGDDDADLEQEEGQLSIQLTSTAFTEGADIPVKYTCDDQQEVSPPLSWSGVPQGTRSIALIADDPDAPGGTWVHWVLYGIGPDVTELPEGVSAAEVVSGGAKQGTNDFSKLGYGGPCPPKGSPHRYFFKLYALDTEIDMEAGAKKKELLRAMEGHVLARGQLMGRYQRK